MPAAPARLVGAAEAVECARRGTPRRSRSPLSLTCSSTASSRSTANRAIGLARRARARCPRDCRAPARAARGRRRAAHRSPPRRIDVGGLARSPREAPGDGREQHLSAATVSRRSGSGPRSARAISSRSSASRDRRSVSSAADRRVVSSSSAPARTPQGELDLGAQQRQRRAQLVARVGDEAALVLEGRLERASISLSVVAQPGDLVVGSAAPAGAPGRRSPRPRRRGGASPRPAAALPRRARSRRATPGAARAAPRRATRRSRRSSDSSRGSSERATTTTRPARPGRDRRGCASRRRGCLQRDRAPYAATRAARADVGRRAAGERGRGSPSAGRAPCESTHLRERRAARDVLVDEASAAALVHGPRPRPPGRCSVWSTDASSESPTR